MSAFTDRLYLTWLAGNGCKVSRGYGARPHGQRREGYPSGQTVPPVTPRQQPPARPMPVKVATSRSGSPRANDAASRPEKPAVLPSAAPFFYPAGKNLQSNQHLMDLYIV
jgi:hypothetical protein